MSSSIDYKTLTAWCQDAITILALAGVSERIVGMQRAAVARNAESSALYEIADSLAEGLSALPAPKREAAARELLAKHGFGFDLFANKRLGKVKAILKRGKIRNEAEFEVVSDFAGDTTHDDLLREAADSLLAAYRV